MTKEAPLQDWFNEQRETTDNSLIYKGASANQIIWVRDVLTYLFSREFSYEERKKHVNVTVISSHRSKSVILPVYKLFRDDLNLQIILRNNFYNWKMSVISEKPIVADFSGLFHTSPPIDPEYTGNELSSVYFEGFPKDSIFNYYDTSDKKKFSAQIESDENLYTTLFLILKSFNVIKPYQWSSRPKS